MAAQRAQPAAREPAGLPAGERGLAGRDGGNGGAESVSGGVEGAVGRPAGTGLAQPSQLRRISDEMWANRRGKSFALSKTFSRVLVVETYPLYRGVSFWHSATENVSAQQYADQGREGTPLLHGGGKSASAIGESSTAASFVPGRNQRQPTSSMAQNAGGVR